MSNGPCKRDLGTGDVGRLCGVCRRTVANWIDGGLMAGYRIPATRRDRRVKVEEVIRFIKEHGLPMPPELKPPE